MSASAAAAVRSFVAAVVTALLASALAGVLLVTLSLAPAARIALMATGGATAATALAALVLRRVGDRDSNWREYRALARGDDDDARSAASARSMPDRPCDDRLSAASRTDAPFVVLVGHTGGSEGRAASRMAGPVDLPAERPLLPVPVRVDAAQGIVIVGRGALPRAVFRAVVVALATPVAPVRVELRAVGDEVVGRLAARLPPSVEGAVADGVAIATFLPASAAGSRRTAGGRSADEPMAIRGRGGAPASVARSGPVAVVVLVPDAAVAPRRAGTRIRIDRDGCVATIERNAWPGGVPIGSRAGATDAETADADADADADATREAERVSMRLVPVLPPREPS